VEVRVLLSPLMKTVQEQIIEEFSVLEDWMERYDHLITIGRRLPKMSESNKVEENLIKGCQSKVWLHSELIEGKLIFTADSDTTITKGMIYVLIRAFSGLTPTEILTSNLDFVAEIGLMQHISNTRSNGLLSMFKQMKIDASKYI
jgi:cysteine desulfuration protein SufE